ncbi:hypothetical protein MYSTI_00030 [Myxococcus stipitatus DSM 14675]|uniref:FG-GAP repeat-containing protein n=1 Tax=Myxococcus stipitatus (strain DSM 14675 / JCM 12634 / Mx s8) TaxID=1278073 RepID=L7U4E8_MYXSD|nr:hypothetical protein [Myxococcus stipitatus]AGC41389.1 hypothetical protein MYSTI_00030 [Myxococcus stipitatus DSM 14675]
MTSHRSVLAVMAFTLLTSPSVHAEEPQALVQSTTADLNGDGKPEAISVKGYENNGDFDFVLTVGVSVHRMKVGSEVLGLSLLDLDSSDKFKEVAVHSGMTDTDNIAIVFRYDDRNLKPLGTVPALTEVKGNGIILSDSWRGFWNGRDKYVVDPKTQKLTLVPQEFYYVGQEATVRESFPITQTRSDKKPVAQLAVGSRIQVVAAARVPGSPHTAFAYLVKSSTGLMGWTTPEVLSAKTDGLPWAG